MLATEWRRLDDLTMEFTLRQGVKFHDGSEMTSEDVAFTFGPERMMSPQSRGYAPSRPFLGTIDRVEATGPHTVRVVTRQSDPLLERRLAGWGGPDHRQEGLPRCQGLECLGPHPGRHWPVQGEPTEEWRIDPADRS